MMSQKGDDSPDSDALVVVDEVGVLARWADWQGRAKQVPIAAIAAENERPTMFVANEVLVDIADAELVPHLERMGATVVPQAPLLLPPDGAADHELTGEFPMPIRLQFSEPPRIEGATRRLTELYGQHGVTRGVVRVTSEGAAQVASLVAGLIGEGRGISLNGVGSTEALPLASAEEDPGQVGGSDPFSWAPFSGRSRIVEAWQLVESVRAVSSVKPVVWIAILDGGFWLSPSGTPLVPSGQSASDFGGGVLQVNLLDEAANASGTNPNKCTDDSVCRWHGNQVASAAAAVVNNRIGAAGSGGTVARPVFFRSRLSEDQVYRCLQYCTAWGLDVLNMSFSMKRSEFFFATSTWDTAFNFAVANGVILVAAAGNDGEVLPDLNVRPATRTPGVITVGALDRNDQARGSSNYGTSVTVWAPGTEIPVAPDGDNPSGSMRSGTSMAAPIVAGVAAMMRAVNPRIDPLTARRIISDTAWPGSNRVSRGLDAKAAVLQALGGTLPRDYSEPNDTMATAAALYPTGPNGSLQPLFGGIAVRSGADPDHYVFPVATYSTVTISLEWYARLSQLYLSVEADDPQNTGPADLTRIAAPGGGTTGLSGLLAPDRYRIRIGGTGDTAYRLSVTLAPAKIARDAFEPNDSFETATRLVFEPSKGEFGPIRLLEWGPGSFPATLHAVRSYLSHTEVINPDFYQLIVPESSVFRIPTLTISNADTPLGVTLYSADREVIRSYHERNIKIEPPAPSTCYLEVTGDRVNRYTIATRMMADPRAIPGPLQEELEILPKWWGDPEPFKIEAPARYFGVQVGVDPSDGPAIVFARPDEAVQIDLVDLDGRVMSEGRTIDAGIRVDTDGIEAGPYLVRVSRVGTALLSGKALSLQMLPPR